METQPGGLQLVIAATDRLGLFSDTAGLLASHSVQVRSAVLHTVEGVAVNTWRVDKQVPTDLPDTAYLVKQLVRLEAGETGILASVQRREARAHSSGAVSHPYVELVRDASEAAAVVEVRTVTGPDCCTRSASRSVTSGYRSDRPTSAPWLARLSTLSMSPRRTARRPARRGPRRRSMR